MLNARRTIFALTATAALTGAWLAAGAYAQDKPVLGAKQQATATIVDTTGVTHTITHGRLFSEEVGLLSVSLEPAKDFAFTSGAATLRIPIRSIHEIEFTEEKDGEWTKVTVTDIDKRKVTGIPIATATNEIRGQSQGSVYAELRLKMNSVRRITFTRPPGSRACGKCRTPYHDPAWKYCPRDGEKLPAADK